MAAAPAHHPLLDLYPAPTQQSDRRFYVGRLGDRYRVSMRPDTEPTWISPICDEEIFEWIDLLEAVEAAGDTFTMLELGAGFGRWALRGRLAARRRGKRAVIGFAEAEPKHAKWLRQTMADNGVLPWQYRLFEVAIGGAHGEQLFAVEEPVANKSTEWFGQALTEMSMQGAKEDGKYFGRPLWRLTNDWGVVKVRVVPLSEMLGNYARVDLIDFDLQGAEADAVAEGIALLNTRVMRLHIGTHGHEIEARLREILGGAGWECLRDFPCAQSNETPYGAITFVDGVQSWVNPRLA